MQQVRDWLCASSRICALTGAGISAESGISTFRGASGLWRQFRSEDLATPAAFARDPRLVWEWYDWRRGLIAAAQPNAGHEALAHLEGAAPEFALITQNVDCLHRRAGSRSVVELHGSIWTVICTTCGENRHDDRAAIRPLPPLCRCGGTLRPGVVWFGEPLDNAVWRQAQTALGRAELVLVVGTSSVVYPAAGLIPYAKQAGARVVEINVEETPVSRIADISLRGPAAEILPLLVS